MKCSGDEKVNNEKKGKGTHPHFVQIWIARKPAKASEEVHLPDPLGQLLGCVLYSLFSSCKAAEIETRTWLEDILTRLPSHKGDLADLLPGNWRH